MNRLEKEQSLYLKQHAENPVFWYPWGDEAFEQAQAQDKPLIISIGYSSCHWCHVMAHESFEDEYIAKLMNEHFICVKVDREELPEVDKYYMESVQMMNGQGGWPLNVFCLPDGRPFAGGTYFPANESRGHQIVPWPQLLMRIADFYQRQKEDLAENAEAIVGNLIASNAPLQATGDAIQTDQLFPALQTLLENRDKEYGGFGKAPKFPPCMTLNFLLTMRSTATVELLNKELAAEIDECIDMTLTAMAHGGIYDQIGGGFARYSVDQVWLIPHFEKMLCDNALLIEIYSKAYLRYRKPIFEKVVRETIEWLDREMKSETGAYFSAVDADSEEGEGDFYIWSPQEVEAVLGVQDAKRFCHVYGVSEIGNFENSGRSQLALLEADPRIRDELAVARQKLRIEREKRKKPGTDSKLILSWNALLMKALATAGFVFKETNWILKAETIGTWIEEKMCSPEGRLQPVAYNEAPKGKGTLEDYAYCAEAYLALASVIDIVSPNSSSKWIQLAKAKIDHVLKAFADKQAVGYFFTEANHDERIPQKKEWFDNSTPAGNSSLLHSLSELGVLTGETKYAEAFENLKIAYPGICERAPAAIGHALDAVASGALGIAVIKAKGDVSLKSLHEEMINRPWRKLFLLRTEDPNQPEGFNLCVGTQCLEAAKDPKEIAKKL